MSKELIINASLPEIRIALLEEGKVEELLVERASDKGIVGNIYKGRVTRVLPGMQAAFVDIGLDKAAFLYVDDVVIHSKEDFADVADVSDVADEDTDVGADEGEIDEEGLEAAGDLESDGESDELDAAQADADAGEAAEVGEDAEEDSGEDADTDTDVDADAGSEDENESTDSEEEGEEEGPVDMGPPPEDGDSSDAPVSAQGAGESSASGSSGSDSSGSDDSGGSGSDRKRSASSGRGRGRGRGRRGSRNRRGRRPTGGGASRSSRSSGGSRGAPEEFEVRVDDSGRTDSDRVDLTEMEEAGAHEKTANVMNERHRNMRRGRGRRPEFRERRGRDRRVRSTRTLRRKEDQPKIETLLKEGQEVVVQVAKDPIANKGARLTCHVSLAGRHLVCMPTINHVGVSRRIELDSDRRRLRNLVESVRPDGMGFIVRTASASPDVDNWMIQDVEYLSNLWSGIRKESEKVSAPAMIYEDLNPILRSIRDWAGEDIHKVIIDSRYFYNEVKDFVSRFMPNLENQIELYHGDIPILDAYGISTELHRSLERRVWLKSGGYIVIDQAEALVAIDVNTGRYVGKKNLEDTILKTNLEAVEEVAYQLRLRNCGGIIIIDLIDMEKPENRERVLRALEIALERDRSRPTVVKMSDLGLIEMTRKRTRDTMIRTLCQSCNYCEGRGFIKTSTTVAYEVLREVERAGIDRSMKKILVKAHPDVIDILANEEFETITSLEKRYRKDIYLQAVLDFHPEQFDVSGDEAPKRVLGGRRNQPRTRRPRTTRSSRSSSRGSRDRKRSSGNRTGVESIPVPLEVPAGEGGSTPEVSAASAPNESGDPNSDDVGNRQVSGNGSLDPSESADGNIAAGNAGAPESDGNSGEDFSEEDRLAFLRAQAAQDAALASYGSAEGASTSSAGSGSGRGGRSRSQRGRGQSGQRSDRNKKRSGGSRGGRGGRGRGGGGGGRGGNRGSGRGRSAGSSATSSYRTDY